MDAETLRALASVVAQPLKVVGRVVWETAKVGAKITKVVTKGGK